MQFNLLERDRDYNAFLIMQIYREKRKDHGTNRNYNAFLIMLPDDKHVRTRAGYVVFFPAVCLLEYCCVVPIV